MEGIIIDEHPETASERTEATVRACLERLLGEELARVSCRPLKERKEYLFWMVDNAIHHGVHLEKPALGFLP